MSPAEREECHRGQSRRRRHRDLPQMRGSSAPI